MTLSDHWLVLYPVDPELRVEQSILGAVLSEIGFLGAAIESVEEACFAVGEDFLSQVCFFGCSPDIELEPQTSGLFCYIRIPQPTTSAQLVFGGNVKIPRCPECKVVLKSWLESYKGGLESDRHHDLSSGQQCPDCAAAFDISQLNWRKSAVYSCTQIIIGNIYESEAAPDAALLAALEQATSCGWRYAYLRGVKQ